jgi:hypothetical protein
MKKFERQEGFVALFTCILISLLLLVITLSMVTLETLQLRKAEDSEQSLRAYYAAEAGIEDAFANVLSNTITDTSGSNTCNKNTTYDASGIAGWTCQQITFGGSPSGKLEQPDAAKTVDPGDANYNRVLVEWDQSGYPTAASYNPVWPPFPDQNAFNSASPPFAAPIELSIVQYPRTAFDASKVCHKDPVLGWQPGGCPNGAGTANLENATIIPSTTASGNIGYNSGSDAFSTGSPYKGNCVPQRTTNIYYPSTSYNCYAFLTGFNASFDYLFRIRSRYAGSAYRFSFFDGTGKNIKVSDDMATIDVTAQAGDTYRRTVYKLPLHAGAASGLNFVMYSDNDICKNFDVINNLADSGCPYN